MLNPLDFIPRRYRKTAYVLACLGLLFWSCFQAANGDWGEAVGLMVTSLVTGMAGRHTPLRDDKGPVPRRR